MFQVIDGRLYFQTSSKKIMPVKITFHKPVTLPGKPSSTAHSDDEDEESDFEVADKENINITARPLIVSPSTSSHVSPAKARRIKVFPVSLVLFIETNKVYFSFQPVLHDWCNKGCSMCYPVCEMVHIKEPLLLIKR